MGMVGGSRIEIKIEPDSNPLGLELDIATLDRRNQDDTYPFHPARETVSGMVPLYIATLQALTLAVAPVSECVTQRWHVRLPGNLASSSVMPPRLHFRLTHGIGHLGAARAHGTRLAFRGVACGLMLHFRIQFGTEQDDDG